MDRILHLPELLYLHLQQRHSYLRLVYLQSYSTGYCHTEVFRPDTSSDLTALSHHNRKYYSRALHFHRYGQKYS